MDGIVTVLKSPGMTSSNVVFDVRKIYGEKHAGHLGTLDPAAAGVLPVCLGRATKLFDILVDKDKEYVFECAFGTQTDTQDAYGAVIAKDNKRVDKHALLQILPEFVGGQLDTHVGIHGQVVGSRRLVHYIASQQRHHVGVFFIYSHVVDGGFRFVCGPGVLFYVVQYFKLLLQ